jgi:multiple sugar transport system ATP-binding protein
MASVSFERVEKAYGTTKVIHGVGFDIHDPEFMARHEHHQWQLRRAGADTVVETQDGIRWPVLREPAAVDGLDVSYGVRPEHLAVVECGSAGSVPGEVVVVEPTGAETELLVRSGTSDITVISHGRANIGPGDQIALRVTPGSVHLFDQKSGSRIADVQ